MRNRSVPILDSGCLICIHNRCAQTCNLLSLSKSNILWNVVIKHKIQFVEQRNARKRTGGTKGERISSKCSGQVKFEFCRGQLKLHEAKCNFHLWKCAKIPFVVCLLYVLAVFLACNIIQCEIWQELFLSTRSEQFSALMR